MDNRDNEQKNQYEKAYNSEQSSQKYGSSKNEHAPEARRENAAAPRPERGPHAPADSRPRSDYKGGQGFRGAPRDGFKGEGQPADGFQNNSYRRDDARREPAQDDGFKRDGFKRDAFKRDGFKGDGKGRGGFRRGGSDVDALLDMDQSLLRLMGKRAQLLATLQKGDNIQSDLEKKLRIAWEEGAAKVSRSPRLARDMFALVQALEPIMSEESSVFNLSPAQKPAEIDLPAPLCSTHARLYMLLSLATGCPLNLEHVPLTDAVLEAVKAMNQLGGQFRWEEGGVITNKGGKPAVLSGLDKVIHVGDDAFNFCMVLALVLGMPNRLKIAGGANLRFFDLASLRRFLPQMGARLTTVIPGQEGLPARVECSGMLPAVIVIPEDIPFEFYSALLLAAPFWEHPVSFEMSPQPHLASMLATVLPIMELVGISVIREEKDERVTLTVQPGVFQVPLSPHLPMDPILSGYLLAIPAFVGGSVRLHGTWLPAAVQMPCLLRNAGLHLEINEEYVFSRRIGENSNNIASPNAENPVYLQDLQSDLYPLAVVLEAIPALRGQAAALPPMPANIDHAVLLSFLVQLGLEENADGLLSKTEPVLAPWISPTAIWALALALGAFLRPNIGLANPTIMNQCHPLFWTVYNGLPKPVLPTSPLAPTEPKNEKSGRRRIIAQGVYGEIPPDPPAADSDGID